MGAVQECPFRFAKEPFGRVRLLVWGLWSFLYLEAPVSFSFFFSGEGRLGISLSFAHWHLGQGWLGLGLTSQLP